MIALAVGLALVALGAAGYALFRLTRQWADDRLEASAARETAARDRDRRERLEAATIEEFRRVHANALESARGATDEGPAAVAASDAWARLRGPRQDH